MRRAVVSGDVAAVVPLLVGGATSRTRLAIHHRHYQTSLVRALTDRFPATVWLTGSAFLADAARQFVSAHPPDRPCIAEYGDEFPAFLSGLAAASELPYLRDFAELERRFGQAALEIDLPPLAIGAIAALDPIVLVDSTIALQPGVRYWHATWPVDDLFKAYLTNLVPDRFELHPESVNIEVHGARGNVRVHRLSAGDFTFRTALASRCSLGIAAERALDTDSGFDPGRALAALVADGLATAISTDGR